MEAEVLRVPGSPCGNVLQGNKEVWGLALDKLDFNSYMLDKITLLNSKKSHWGQKGLGTKERVSLSGGATQLSPRSSGSGEQVFLGLFIVPPGAPHKRLPG